MDTLQQLTMRAQQARASGNLDKALEFYRLAQKLFPHNISAAHNLASVLNDLQRFNDARHYIEHALHLGGKSPQTWLMYARILTELQQFETAIKAYQTTIQLIPASYEAHREYAQLQWMCTESQPKAMELIDVVLRQYKIPSLLLLKSQVFEFSGDFKLAFNILGKAANRWPDDLSVQTHFVFTAIRAGNTRQAIETAKHVLNLAPKDKGSYLALSYAYLADGQPREALLYANEGLLSNKYSQELIANKATALRLLGSSEKHSAYKDEYNSLYDYSELVAKIPLGIPNGWSSRELFFTDLASELKKLHPYKSHPFGQSVRHGSQLPNILSFNNPIIETFKEVLEKTIEQYLDNLKPGKHSLLERKTSGWKIDGIWSVWLKPGGYHEDHIHSNGWLSTACYIELPDIVNDESRKTGWLRLGQPGLPTKPSLQAEHWVKPEVGHLVIFPSYMWHGTSLFTGDQPRLSIALDIIPA